MTYFESTRAFSLAAIANRPSVVVSLTLAASLMSGWWLVPEFGFNSLLLIGGVIALTVVIFKPLLGVYVLILTIPIQSVVLIGGDVTFTRIIGIVVIGAWTLQRVLRRFTWQSLLSARVLQLATLFVLFGVVSLVWAEDFDSAGAGAQTIVQLLALSALVVGAINTPLRLEWAIRVLIIGASLASVFTLVQFFFQDVDRAGDLVSGGGVNHTAVQLVVLIPFGVYLIRASNSGVWRLLGITYVTLAVLAVITTFSRTSMVFLPLVLGAQLFLVMKDGRRNFLLTIFGVSIAGAVLFTVIPWERALTRWQTIAPALRYQDGDDNEGTAFETGRTHLWLGAMYIFRDNPIVGTGYANFGGEFLSAQFLVPAQFIDGFTSIRKSPHSTFLGILAELGIIGGILWVSLHITAFRNVMNSRSGWKGESSQIHTSLIAALLFCLAVYSMYGFISVTHNHKLFWIILGFTEVVRRLSRLKKGNDGENGGVSNRAPSVLRDGVANE